MKIKSVRIENFRCFHDETISFNDYTCLLGPNGAGKSTVLAALNVFFRQYKDSKTDLSKLSADDFHHKNVKDPIKITVTFCNLSDEAKSTLSDYVRQDLLIVSVEAKYDSGSERAEIRQFGNRLGMDEFRKYFEADKRGENVQTLKEIYTSFKAKYPDLEDAKTKAAMIEALNTFEASNPNQCALIPSEDQFYGATKGANKLAPYLQWVFVPAVKDITEESHETKTSGLGQLLARTIRSKVDFNSKIAQIRDDLRERYQTMLDEEQSVLTGLSDSIELRLKDWAHPAVTAKVLWTQDAEKSVKVDEPWAYIRIGERGFESDLARFGHGMQRSFMLTLLQELAGANTQSAPTLILAIEEPELYQHPPQIRYLAELLHDLAIDNSQIVVCSHSPLFIPGDDFETVRLIRDSGIPSSTTVTKLSYSELEKTLNAAGQKHLKEKGMLAKLYPSLNPGVNEMFFCRILILVEGIEDVAHLSSYIALQDLMKDFRKYGCHIVPVGGKSEVIRPLAMAKQLKIPVFVVVDADADDEKHTLEHKRDNKQILALMGYDEENEWPVDNIWKKDLVMWKNNLTTVIESEVGDSWVKYVDNSAKYYGQPGGLKKNPLAISRAWSDAWKEDIRSVSMEKLTSAVISFAHESIKT